MAYIYSTLTNDQEYVLYKKTIDPKQIPVMDRVFFVNGMANVINPKTMITPKGAVTFIPDDDLKVLEQISGFKNHKERGFLTVSKTKDEPDKVAADMTAKDKSAQLVASDFEEGKEPVTNAEA